MGIKAQVMEKLHSFKEDEKGQALGLNSLYTLVFTIAIVGTLLVVVRRILVRFKRSDSTAEENQTIDDVLEALDEITDWFIIIVGTVIGVVVLIILIRALTFLRASGAAGE